MRVQNVALTAAMLVATAGSLAAQAGSPPPGVLRAL